MSKNSRAGGKYSGKHTTLIPAAATVCDIAHRCPSITRISPSLITGGIRSANGNRRVKITEYKGALLLSVRDNTTHQKVYVYGDDLQEAKLAIARGAREAHLNVSFGNRGENREEQ